MKHKQLTLASFLDLSHIRDGAHFLSVLQSYECEEDNQVHFVILLARKHPAEIIQLRQLSGFSASLRKQEPNLHWFRIHNRSESVPQNSRNMDVCIVPTQLDGVFLGISIGSGAAFKNTLEKYINALHPALYRPFFAQKELSQILFAFNRKIGPQKIRLTKVISRSRIGMSDARRHHESHIKWTDKDLDTVFNEAKERNEWFLDLRFDLVDPNAPGFSPAKATSARISKYGHLACNRQVERFYEDLLSPMVSAAADKLKMFLNRGRKETANHEPKPIVIQYETELFKDIKQNHVFISAVRKLKNASCSVIHGNPYIHLSVMDHYDGSGFDVWVLNTDQVMIVPQIKTSASALKRICNHLFEEFSEGKIEDAASLYAA
jgi:hypothetical protein